jgi:hypothetical protein
MQDIVDGTFFHFPMVYTAVRLHPRPAAFLYFLASGSAQGEIINEWYFV